jgi:hypothetical protein
MQVLQLDASLCKLKVRLNASITQLPPPLRSFLQASCSWEALDKFWWQFQHDSDTTTGQQLLHLQENIFKRIKSGSYIRQHLLHIFFTYFRVLSGKFRM